LDILAKKRKTGIVTGQIFVNGEEIHDRKTFRRLTGYVDQEDIHIPCLTVQETLEFSASVRLPESITAKEKSMRVEIVLSQLGLAHIANSRVGDAIHRGISGGEKKRLSIAVELVTNPSVIFIDEPTSGLDSFNALQVIQTLATLARDHQKTVFFDLLTLKVIFTVHQPNSAIYSLFDNVLLLSRGKSVYFGPASDAEAYWSSQGHPCPKTYHIADHLLDVASTVIEPIVVADVDGLRYRGKKEGGDTSRHSVGVRGSDEKLRFSSLLNCSNDIQGASKLTQIQQVLGRELKVFLRSPTLFISHLTLSIGLGVFIGMLYYQVDNSIAGLQNRLGSIFFIQALLAFGGLSAISSLNVDRILFIRERSNGFYSPEVYFLQKVLFDLIPLRIIPALVLVSTSYFLIGFTNTTTAFLKFLLIMVVFSMNAGLHDLAIASLIPSTSTSTLASVMSILFQMLFSGILVNQVNIPSGLRWIQYISFFKYAYEGCIASESAGLSVKTTIAGIDVNIPASTVLKSFGIDAGAYYFDMTVTIGVCGVLLVGIWAVMKIKLKERR
jgi:ABC-type multidrug transport system ATPase subunit/ABC-type multidrug transport system permease subunit